MQAFPVRFNREGVKRQVNFRDVGMGQYSFLGVLNSLSTINFVIPEHTMDCKMARPIVTTILFLLLQPGGLLGQSASFQFKHLTPADGLASTTVVDITQDAYGFMWIGSQDGISRFDGESFKHFRPNPGDSLSISSLDAQYLVADRNGGIWITITDLGLDYYDPEINGFRKYRTKDGLPAGQRFTEVSVDGEGVVWAATDSSVYRLDAETDRFQREEAQSRIGSIYRLKAHDNGELIYFHQAPTGELYIGRRSETGEYTYEPMGRRLNPGGNHPYRMHLFSDTEGTEWLVNQNHVAKKTGEAEDWEIISVRNRACLDNLREALFDKDGLLWVKNTDVLCRIDLDSGEADSFRHNPEDPTSILPVRSGEDSRMYIDRQGILWVARYASGISRIDLYGGGFRLYNIFNQLPSNDVISVMEARDGTFWVGTRMLGNSLLRLNQNGNVIARYGTNYFDAPRNRSVATQLSHPHVLALAESRDGSIWAGTGSSTTIFGGLNRIRPGSSSITRFKHDDEDPSSIPNNNIQSLAVDGSDRVWFLSSSRQIHWMNPRNERIQEVELPQTQTVNKNRTQFLYTDSVGNLWIFKSGRKNPFYLDHETMEITPVELVLEDGTPVIDLIGEYRSIHEADSTTYWIGTNSGFGKFDPSTGIVSSWYNETNLELPASEISAIQSDTEGNIWLSTINGIVKFNPITEVTTDFGYDHGLQGNIFNSTVSDLGSNGLIYFGGAGGLNVFDPESIRPNPFPPDLVFSDLYLDGSIVEPAMGMAIDKPLLTAQQITIPPSVTTITIEFSALHFASPNRNQYRYRLEGFDTDWRNGGTISSATYTNLPPGEYNFRLMASNRDGVWSNGDDQIKILRVLPPWYRTWFAYGVYFILFAGMMFIADRAQRRRLTQKERERTRERELQHAKEIEKAYRDLEKTHAKLETAHENLKVAQDQLVQQEKLASLGQLTAGIAHEIKNPLNFVNNFSEISLEMVEEAKEEVSKLQEKSEAREELEFILNDIEGSLGKINEHGKRADSIVQSMLMHSRSGSSKMEPTDLNKLVKEAANLSFHGMKATDNSINVDLNFELSDNVGEIPIIAEDFSRVILNICNNAFDAMQDKVTSLDGKEKEEYLPKLTIRTVKKGGKVTIDIEDNGPGIPKDIKAKILQPFFTTKKGTQGTGLGLSITNDIVKAHGGQINIESEPGSTCFIITLSK
ncbi:sensor histidine kinase [Rhodohalobacter sp. 614A]|uniref:sensor histidine kinase n=1 Tax=Rhodohalobacter sp. 614A TaxID=2908649 RepID=UPI001F483DA1